MHKQVQEFIKCAKENARKVWNKPNDDEFVNDLLYISEQDDGSTTISDNYEHFFDIIYRVTSDGEWSYRRALTESSEWKSYSFAKAMSDASIMYTG